MVKRGRKRFKDNRGIGFFTLTLLVVFILGFFVFSLGSQLSKLTGNVVGVTSVSKITGNGILDFVKGLFSSSGGESVSLAPDPNLVAAYSFDDGTAIDLSGKGNTGTVIGATSVVGNTGYGNALSFNGGDYVTIPSSASLLASQQLTISLWINPVSYSNNPYLLNFGDTSGNKKWKVFIDSMGLINFQISTEGSQHLIYLAGTTPVPLNSWTHVAVVFNSGVVQSIYINGLQDASRVPASGTIFTGGTEPLTIGIRGGVLSPFNGLIDEVRIYDRALTQAEINTDMTTPLGGISGCTMDTDCDDGNPCTDDTCNVGTGSCQFVNNDANTCDNGLFCDGIESCNAGSCISTGNPCILPQVCNDVSNICESDTTPPVISSIQSNPSQTSSTITWTTDEASDSVVRYGTVSGGPYGLTSSDLTLTTSHSISLTGLTEGLVYYYVVSSTDASSNTATSTQNSFTTLAPSAINVKPNHPRIFIDCGNSADWDTCPHIRQLRAKVGIPGYEGEPGVTFGEWATEFQEIQTNVLANQNVRFAGPAGAFVHLMLGPSDTQFLNIANGALEFTSDYQDSIIAFDWLYNDLTSAQRATYANALLTGPGYGSNWVWDYADWTKQFTGARNKHSLIDIALYGNSELTSTQLTNVQNSLENDVIPFYRDYLYPHNSMTALDGGVHESHQYGHAPTYKFVGVAWTFEALRTATSIDLWQGYQPTEGYARWLLYSIVPADSKVNQVDDIALDAVPIYPAARATPLIANRHQDPMTQYLWEGYSNSGQKYFQDVGNMLKWVQILWEDTSLAPSDPTTFPTAAHLRGKGIVYMRSDWNGYSLSAPQYKIPSPETQDITYATFKAGELYTGHQHADSGSFVIHKGSRLALDTGVKYGDCDHIMKYHERTIAHNALIIYNPDESFNYANTCVRGINDGGQINPGYDAQFWTNNAPDGLEAGDILAYDHNPSKYTYAMGDITCAYQSTCQTFGGACSGDPLLDCSTDQNCIVQSAGLTCNLNTPKVSNVQREFLYLRSGVGGNNDYFVIYDRVSRTDPAFKTQFLLHMQNEPSINGNVVNSLPLEGATEYGGDEIVISYSTDKLYSKTLLPLGVEKVIRKRGGPGYEFWTDGTNYLPSKLVSESFGPMGNWRTEIESTDTINNDIKFLHVLHPTVNTNPPVVSSLVTTTSGNMQGAFIETTPNNKLAMFSSEVTGNPPVGNIEFSVVPTTSLVEVLLMNLQPGQGYDYTASVNAGVLTVTLTSGGTTATVNSQGVLQLNLNVFPSTCTVNGDCSDGLACNGDETCNAGSCQSGSPVVCTSPQICEEPLGNCVDPPLPPTCQLTNAQWSTASAVEGDTVSLTVTGTDCNDGEVVSLQVKEDDLFSGDDLPVTQPGNIVFSGGIATGTWTAEWQPDGLFNGDPEYYFIATLISDLTETVTSSVPLLSVSQIQDTTLPEISNIQSNPSQTSSTITWTTDEDSDSVVNYGTVSGGPYGLTSSDLTLTTSHSMSLTGLTEGLVYYYVVSSTDASSNTATSTQNSFTTLASSIPSISISSPLEGSIVSTSDLTLNFFSDFFIVSGKNSDHVHFYLDGDTTPFMMYNGVDNIVEYNSLQTTEATWINENTIQFNNLADGLHTIKAVLSDSLHSELINPEAQKTVSFTIDTISLPIRPTITHDNYYDGQTTDFSNVAVDLSNFPLILERTEFGKIEFQNNIGFTTDANIHGPTDITSNNIVVDTNIFPQLNVPATLTLRGLSFTNPRILRDGAVCDVSVCVIQSYTGGELVFTVTGFSTYSAEETPFCGDGICNGGENTASCVTDCPESSGGGSSGGGGGGGGGGTPSFPPGTPENTVGIPNETNLPAPSFVCNPGECDTENKMRCSEDGFWKESGYCDACSSIDSDTCNLVGESCGNKKCERFLGEGFFSCSDCRQGKGTYLTVFVVVLALGFVGYFGYRTYRKKKYLNAFESIKAKKR